MIITSVQRPQLTEEERAKRMKEIKHAAVQLVCATHKNHIQHRRTKTA